MLKQEHITAIILAAGRGSRMKDFTQNIPKCLLQLAEKSLLQWQVESIQKAQIEKILVVRGYLAEKIQGDFNTVENTRWAQSNMVSSLLCALEVVKDHTVFISYSDIVYKSAHVTKIVEAQGDICITYDTQWESLWRLRNENPLDDAETFKQEHGLLVEIGKKTDTINNIQGQYMGLIKLSPKGQECIKNYLATLEQARIDKLDMTSLLQALLENNTPIHTVPVEAGWCECDTQQDILLYEEALQSQAQWTHDWRNGK